MVFDLFLYCVTVQAKNKNTHCFQCLDKDYHSIEEVAEALVNRQVEGVLVDSYAAGLKSDLFDPPAKVSSVIDYKTAYGIVLSPNSTRLGKCFERYMLSHRAEIFEMIKTKVKPIAVSNG